MTTFNWAIPTTEYDLKPADMDGAIIVAHWRCNAEQTEGTGDDAVTHRSSSYGTCGFTPDPSSSDYTPYADVTEEMVKNWVFANGVDKDAVEANLQIAIDNLVNPPTASGVPW
tara:strand:+ start:291 stop:629 length:339 start_codon:yes stop_codon:yes gene_type:complete